MDRYKNLVLGLLKHELISGSLYLFIGGIVGSFLSFIYNLFLARTLSQPDYGTYVSLLSFETLIIIPTASLTAIIVRFATHYFAEGHEDKAAHLLKRMSLVWIAIGLVIFLAIYLLRPFLSGYLKLTDPALLIPVGLGIGLAYVGVVNTSFLQSLLKFKYISFAQIVGNVAKIIIGASLVLAGARAMGGLIGILMSPLALYILGFWPLRKLILKKSGGEETIETKDIVSYGVLAAIGLISLSSFISTDVILVKHFFSDSEAGLYGGLSIIGKVIFYFTAPIPSVMFPLLVKRHTAGEKYHNLFFLSLILVFLPSVAITIFYFIFPAFTASLFLGKNYLNIVPYLWLFGIFITIFNLASLSTNFFLSLKKTNVSFIVLFFAIFQIILIYLFHGSFYHIIYSGIASLSLLLLSLMLYYKFQKA